jgi:hypothetical protein
VSDQVNCVSQARKHTYSIGADKCVTPFDGGEYLETWTSEDTRRKTSTFFFNKATLRRPLADFSYTRYSTCKLVKPLTINSHTHLSILITSLSCLKMNTQKHLRTSTSTCTSKQESLTYRAVDIFEN